MRKWKLPETLFGVLGAVTVLYITGISLYWGRLDGFNLGVGAAGFLLCLYSLGSRRGNPRPVPAKPRHPAVRAVFFGVLASFVIVEGAILYTMGETPERGADCLVVLGCQVDGEIPSVPLSRRALAAAGYLHENPRTKAVVTGGRGPGERISESEAMRRILLGAGIAEDRILMEERAASTFENLVFSDARYGLADKRVVIVSSDYHLFRALSLAKRLGYRHVSGLGSKSLLPSLPIYLLREYAAVLYYIVRGRAVSDGSISVLRPAPPSPTVP
ncbi:MAG: YdcF family protein [Spirochaetaceae bacterium]|jgi:uncharacterized SAM-binding protein YcdF (DUF218 family)|nr:YdcF family protein [Spirochaetaceae bacterium]